MSEVQGLVRAFASEHRLTKSPEIAVLDLVAEVGELAKEVLSATEYGRRTFSPPDTLPGEIGDALYSLLDLANVTGVDAEAALRDALAKYRARIAARGRPASS